MESKGSEATRKRKGSKHDKTGCLTCRYRRKKCLENTFPICGACQRLNLECIREPVRQLVPVPRQRSKSVSDSAPITTLSLNWAPLREHGGIDSLQRRHIMRHYVTILTELLTISQAHNSFLSAYLPMAMESNVLSDALVAWSSGHIASMDPSYETTALEARSVALHALARSVASPVNTASFHETNTAACLVLLTSEVCQGDRAGWYNHLLGAKNIIESARHLGPAGEELLAGPEVFKQSSEGQWVLRNFAYHDVLGSVTLGRPPLINATYLEGITDVVDTYLGVASEVLTFISEVGLLDHTSPGFPPGSSESTTTHTTPNYTGKLESYVRVKTKLHGWRCDPSTPPELAAVAYAYRSAALIHVYRRIVGLLRLCERRDHIIITREYMQDMISSISAGLKYQANQILAHVSKIPLNDIPESVLLFPLFMAGGELDPQHVAPLDMIRTRLTMILEKRHFKNVLSALEILEELWARKSRPAGSMPSPEIPVDWEDILREQGGLLLLT